MSDDPSEDGERSDVGDPLGDLAAEVDDRRQRGGHEDDAFDAFDAFEEVEVGEVDADQLWTQLMGEEGAGRTVAIAPPEESDDGRDVRTIPKSTCHGCQYFGDPPELHCTHEGTEIEEMVDYERFRVVDCPMVVDEEELGDLDV